MKTSNGEIISWISSFEHKHDRSSRPFLKKYPPNNITKPTQPLDANALNHVYFVEEIIQLNVHSDTEIITNTYWTKKSYEKLLSRIYPGTLLSILIASTLQRHIIAQGVLGTCKATTSSYMSGLCFSIAYWHHSNHLLERMIVRLSSRLTPFLLITAESR